MQVIYGINPLLEIFHSHPAMLEKIVIAEGRERGSGTEDPKTRRGKRDSRGINRA